MKTLETDYQTFIALSRYARFLPDKKRRETWDETVGRYCDFWTEEYDHFPRELVYNAILNLEVMPSMRALMTAGKALQKDHAAGYNCAYVAVDDVRAFDETMYLLMCGAGVGFSVERQAVAKLPVVAEEFHETETIIKVKDSKIGWAAAYRELISLLYSGQLPKWDLSALRPAGAPLKTFGGRSSGPQPLDELLKATVRIFKNASGRKLTSIECHDLMNHIAAAIVVGGVRRSAQISLSNLSDDRMRSAKSGQWWVDNPQRALANNSVAYTEKPDIGIFMDEWKALYDSKSGERGLFNRVAAVEKMKKLGRRDWKKYDESNGGVNPCAEIFLRSCGFCNLSEVIVRENDTLETLLKKVQTATILGTFQSSLTNFRYLRSIWKKNSEEERLLGVSLTGIMDHPVLSNVSDEAKSWLIQMKDVAIKTNQLWADKLGINRSVAITTCKPSGCTTLETEIKTTMGYSISMGEIFSKLGYTADDLVAMSPGTWLSVDHDPNVVLPHVLDENNEPQEITKLYVNGIKEVYEITFEDGKSYKFTGNHKLLTDTGWKCVENITSEDNIISWS